MKDKKMRVYSGDVYYAKLDDLHSGTHDGYCQVVILRDNKCRPRFPTMVVLPIRHTKLNTVEPYQIGLDGESGFSAQTIVCCELMTTTTALHLQAYVGTLSKEKMEQIKKVVFSELGDAGDSHGNRPPVETQMVMTLCGQHARMYANQKCYKMVRLNHGQDKESCSWCNRMGLDYAVIPIKGEH